jgi:hypothetical protein
VSVSPGWPPVSTALVAALGVLLPEAWVATRFPAHQPSVQDLLAKGTTVVRVIRNGGTRDRDDDHARIGVDVIAPDEDTAENTAEAIATWMVDTRPIRGAGFLLDGADTEVAPHPVPYPDPEAAQFAAFYVVHSRRIDAV